jgi:hypothetical protein
MVCDRSRKERTWCMEKDGDVKNNIEVVVYVLAILGGAEKSVHTEAIAAKAHELAPGRFSWTLPAFSEKGWPDKYVAKTALEDAKKEQWGAMAEGSYNREPTKDGWCLTERGAKWFRDNEARIERSLGSREPRVRQVERKRFLGRIRKQPLFRRFARTGSLEGSTDSQFAELLNCSSDAPTDIVASKFHKMRAKAALVADDEISLFLDACAQQFRPVLGEIDSESPQEDGAP